MEDQLIIYMPNSSIKIKAFNFFFTCSIWQFNKDNHYQECTNHTMNTLTLGIDYSEHKLTVARAAILHRHPDAKC